MVVLEDRLLTIAKDFNINCLKAEQFKINEYVMVNAESVEDFFNKVSALEAKDVFYLYLYNHKEDYIITDELILDSDDRIKSRVQEYNDKIEKIDFSQPKALYLAVIKDGMPITCRFVNDKVMELDLKPSLEAIEMIEDELDEELEIDYEAKLKELEEYILKNATDLDMRNMDFRYEYLRKLLDFKFKGYDRYFNFPFGHAKSGNAKIFMDKVKYKYNQQKENS